MKVSRSRVLWWLGAVAVQCSTLNLLDVVNTYPQLSTLKSYFNASQNITSLLQNSNEVTFFAPSNDAIANYEDQNGNLTADAMQALMEFSLLRGGYPILSFANTSQFIASHLTNPTYANITGGQRVELVLGSDGMPEVITGNKSISTSSATDIICSGGIVHIVDTVLSIPISGVAEIALGHFEFLISILNTGGFLSAANADFVDATLNKADVTYFLPNTAEALAKFEALSQNESDLEKQELFNYHILPNFTGYTPSLTDGLSLETLQGANVTITVQDGDTYINAAKIISRDWLIANGVIHLLDDFLDRSNTSGPPPPQATSSTSSSTSTQTPASSSTGNSMSTSSSSHSGLSKGAEGGVGAGAGVAGLLVTAALAWWCRRRKDKKAWNMSGVPTDLERFYIKRGTVQQRQDDSNLGLQSTGMHEGPRSSEEDGGLDGTSSPFHSSKVSGPSIPPRSPERML